MKDSGENWCIFSEDVKYSGEKTRLLVKSQWTPELFDVVKHFNVHAFQLTDWHSSVSFLADIATSVRSLSVYGDSITGLEVLPELRMLRDLSISGDGLGCSANDMSVISELENLEILSISGRLGKIDFTRLRKLLDLCVNNENLDGNWTECYWLRHLVVGNMRLKNVEPLGCLAELEGLSFGNRYLQSFEGIEKLTRLRDLAVGDMNWSTLAGVERVPELAILRIIFMSKLEDIGAVAKLRNLRRLDIRYCPRLYDLSPLAKLKELQMLDLSDCKKLCSIRPLAGLKRLQSFCFVGNCKIDDGDSLRVLLDLPKLRFARYKPWKHYSHTSEQIQDAICTKGVRLAENLKEIELEP